MVQIIPLTKKTSRAYSSRPKATHNSTEDTEKDELTASDEGVNIWHIGERVVRRGKQVRQSEKLRKRNNRSLGKKAERDDHEEPRVSDFHGAVSQKSPILGDSKKPRRDPTPAPQERVHDSSNALQQGAQDLMQSQGFFDVTTYWGMMTDMGDPNAQEESILEEMKRR